MSAVQKVRNPNTRYGFPPELDKLVDPLTTALPNIIGHVLDEWALDAKTTAIEILEFIEDKNLLVR